MLVKKQVLTYTEIKNQLGLTDATVSKHLEILLKGNIIEYEKKGRSKLYSLKKTAFTQNNSKLDLMGIKYVDDVGYELFKSKYASFDEFIENVDQKLSGYFFYTIMKSIENGENWLPVFNSKEMFEMVLDFVVVRILEKGSKSKVDIEEILDPIGRIGEESFFPKFLKLIKKNPTYESNFRNMKNTIEKKYQHEIELLNNPKPLFRKQNEN